MAWLVCEDCGTKEAVLEGTEFFGGCKSCGGNRSRAEDDNGNPVIVFSALSDPTDWSVETSVLSLSGVAHGSLSEW